MSKCILTRIMEVYTEYNTVQCCCVYFTYKAILLHLCMANKNTWLNKSLGQGRVINTPGFSKKLNTHAFILKTC